MVLNIEKREIPDVEFSWRELYSRRFAMPFRGAGIVRRGCRVRIGRAARKRRHAGLGGETAFLENSRTFRGNKIVARKN